MSIVSPRSRFVMMVAAVFALVAAALSGAPAAWGANAPIEVGADDRVLDGGIDAAVRARLLSVDPDPEAEQTPSLWDVADLNGDGTIERLQTVVEGGTSQEAVTTVFVRDGRTGDVLFTDTFDHLLLNVLSSEDGLVFNTYDFTRTGGVVGVGNAHGDERPSFASTFAMDMAQGVRVLSPTGEVTWTLEGPTTSYVYTGTSLATTTEPIARAFGLADVDGDGRDDLLLGSYTRTPGDGVAGPPQNDEVTVTAVTADGAELVSYTRDISSVEGHIRNAGDVDGDGADEILLAVSTNSDERQGAAIVISPGAPPVEWVIDMNGANTERVLDGGGLVFTRFDGGVTQLLDLATGDLQTLTEPTTSVDVGYTTHGPIGDTDGDGNDDVAVTLREQFGDEVYLTTIVTDLDGEVRRTEYEAPIAQATTAQRASAQLTGDLDGDGVQDLALSYGADDNDDPVREHVVSGRTGASIRDGLVAGRLLGGSVDGQGQDQFETERLGEQTHRVTVRDGLTDQVLWTWDFHGRGDRADAAFASSVGGGPIVEVSIRSASDGLYLAQGGALAEEGFVALHQVGADGRDLWTLGPLGVDRAVDDEAALAAGELLRYPQDGVLSAEQRNSCLDTQENNDEACHSVLVTASDAGVLSARIENQDNPAADIDIYVFRADPDFIRGEEIGRSAGFPGLDGLDPERVDIEVGPGDYIVEFSYYLVPGSSFDEVIDLS